MFIVVYRPHGALFMDTKHYGTFQTWDEAYDFLCNLPALGAYYKPDAGCKYVQELTAVL